MKQLFTTIGRVFVDPWVNSDVKEKEPVKLKSYEKNKVRIPYLTGDGWYSEEYVKFIKEQGLVHPNCHFKLYFEGDVPFQRVYKKRKGRVTELNQNFYDTASMTNTFFIDDFFVADCLVPLIDKSYERIKEVKTKFPNLNCVLVTDGDRNQTIRACCDSYKEVKRMEKIYEDFVDYSFSLTKDKDEISEVRKNLDALLK
ncbi:hypothetical protein KY334_04065 [Candidatus Woesearchaeota archaeon]|nr:hypothetical protein [Candidatus Woesearchaeota archaeon]